MAIHTVHFATNRNEIVENGKTIAFGDLLNPKSPTYLRYGAADLASGRKGDDFKLRELRVAEENLPGIIPGDTGERVLGSEAVFDGLRQRLIDNKADLLLLLHGYACTMENALSNAAYLRRDYASADRPLEAAVFCWPSDGLITPLLAYASDRDDARASAKAVARALHRFVDYLRGLPPELLCKARIHLVAHSMGNYVLRNALQAMLSDLGGRRLPRVFQNIFLMAADEDNDAFEHETKLARLPELAEAVHVYYARDDLALVISDTTKVNPDRLGATGPRTLTNLPQKVTLVDCAAVSTTGSIEHGNHQYYRLRAEVVADVRQVIAGVPPDKVNGRDWIPARSAFRIRPRR
jgi:esterase/lipase superfamily enzyme